MSETAIEVHGLRKRYGDDEALSGVDLTVPRGEIIALLGPNGAGKSTLVEILEGFRHRDGGTARVLGEDPGTAGRHWRSRVGVVWQGETMVPRLPVSDVIRHFAGYYPRPLDPDSVVELVGLGEKTGAGTSSLSGGQRRRLDVALGIVGDPELLFLDEPTTGFDPRARRDFWSLVDDLAEGGTTIVLITHYLEEAEALADRVCVIARGEVRALGAPSELGGHSSAQATVSWTADGRRHRTRTEEPTRVVGELATLFSGEIPDLSVHRPTLEEVYLRLIGEDAPGDGHDGHHIEREVLA